MEIFSITKNEILVKPYILVKIIFIIHFLLFLLYIGMMLFLCMSLCIILLNDYAQIATFPFEIFLTLFALPFYYKHILKPYFEICKYKYLLKINSLKFCSQLFENNEILWSDIKSIRISDIDVNEPNFGLLTFRNIIVKTEFDEYYMPYSFKGIYGLNVETNSNFTSAYFTQEFNRLFADKIKFYNIEYISEVGF